jgi:hypothetical protein
MKYVFHIGERCNSLDVLKNANLLSGMNIFSGLYISFSSVVSILKHNFHNFENNIVKFCIATLSDVKTIEFIRSDTLDQNTKDIIVKELQKGKFKFFFKENYYKHAPYCIQLDYTDICNVSLEDLYFCKNKYCLMPNSDYSNLDTFTRRKNRFVACLNECPKETLLVYMDKLTHTDQLSSFINNIKEMYDFEYPLFYIIPFYNDDNTEENDKIIKHKNITFCCVLFKNLEYQKQNNPNDDNATYLYKKEYNKILEILKETYNLTNITKTF